MKGNFIAYYRVSTGKQGASGLGLEAQRKTVVDYLNGGKWDLVAEVTEVESGKDSDRLELQKALSLCRLYHAKLVVAKLDRLSRNVRFLATLMEDGVDFVCCDMPSANKLTIHILAAVAQAEAEMISTRTKLALEAAKARGVALGGHRVGGLPKDARERGRKRGPALRQKNATRHNDAVLAATRELNPEKLSFAKMAHELNARGIGTIRGGEWTPANVYRIYSH